MKQCVDPKLNNDYPPKAIAKVPSLLLYNHIHIHIIGNVFTINSNWKGVFCKKER